MLSQNYGTASNEFGTSQKNPYAVTSNSQSSPANNSAGAFVSGMSQQPSANPYNQPKAMASTAGVKPTTTTSAVSPTPAWNQSANSAYSNPINYQSWGGNPLFSILASLGRYMAPLAGQQEQFAGQQEQGRENTLQNFINQFSPQGQQAQVNAFGNQANENAGKAAQYAAAQGQSQGLSPAYQAGNTQSEYNNAANQVNQYQAQINSPEYQQRLLQTLLGAYGQAQQNPTLQQISGLQQGIQNQEQINSQNASQGGMLGGLGGILGMLGGGGGLSSLLHLFTGGGGGSTDGSGMAGGGVPGYFGK